MLQLIHLKSHLVAMLPPSHVLRSWGKESAAIRLIKLSTRHSWLLRFLLCSLSTACTCESNGPCPPPKKKERAGDCGSAFLCQFYSMLLVLVTNSSYTSSWLSRHGSTTHGPPWVCFCSIGFWKCWAEVGETSRKPINFFNAVCTLLFRFGIQLNIQNTIKQVNEGPWLVET